MPSIEELVEKIDYFDEDDFIDWYGKLQEFFSPANLDDISELDYSAYTYLISLNKNNEKLLSEEIYTLLEKEDAYFIEIIISRDKPLASFHYWKYPKEDKGQVLNISEKPYLKKHMRMQEKFIHFADENKLIILNDKQLKKQVAYNGMRVSIYYKYFDDEYESTTEIPYGNIPIK